MPLLCVGEHPDFNRRASSRGCMRNDVTDAVMLSESRTDLELPAMKPRSEV